jgi:DNA-directed RNA polymerase specialized sigma24 family protein
MTSDELYAEVRRLRCKLDRATRRYVQMVALEDWLRRNQPPRVARAELPSRMLALVDEKDMSYAELANALGVELKTVGYVARQLIGQNELELAGWGRVKRRYFERITI